MLEADFSTILSGAREIIAHNLKPFITAGDHLREKKVFDTMLAAYLVNPLKNRFYPWRHTGGILRYNPGRNGSSRIPSRHGGVSAGSRT